MNLSCLFGHSWKEKTINMIDLQNSKNYIYETQILFCTCCPAEKIGKNKELYQEYYESELARTYFREKGNEPFVITKDSKDDSKSRFILRLEESARSKNRTAILEKREKYYIITMEAGPDKYSWRF